VKVTAHPTYRKEPSLLYLARSTGDTMSLGIAVPLHAGAEQFYARYKKTAEIKASGKN
jgi:hypothetical protein